MQKRITKSALTLAVLLSSSAIASAASPESIEARLDRLEKENSELKKIVSKLSKDVSNDAARKNSMEKKASQSKDSAKATSEATIAPTTKHNLPTENTSVIHQDSDLGYNLLDPTQAGKFKPLMILDAKKDGRLQKGVTASGAITAIADFQKTNVDIGYLMRQPENVSGKTASEAALHSIQVGLTANISPWISAYSEILYDPEQSFGAGTITSLSRNQLQMRKGYLLIGDLSVSPFYFQIGKLDSAFGQMDTVNPFSLSTDWHTFGGLSYGALVGYSKDGFNIVAEAVQGGAEFRGLNTPVEGTNIPSKLNNYVFDANYSFKVGETSSMRFGASYEAGSPYCQNFPVQHFGTCSSPNPAYSVYGEAQIDKFRLKGSFQQTLKPMPGSFNPNPPLSAFAAHKVSAFDVGGLYETTIAGKKANISLDYSAFIAGPSGAPWNRQTQWVAGLAYFPYKNVKFFTEAIFIEGYAPFEFLTGGMPGPDPTRVLSNSASKTGVLIGGITAAY